VTIAIVDYGAGNLVSVKKAIDYLGQPCAITSDADDVAKATRIILPGVGHFASTAVLARLGLQDAIAEAVARGVFFLGICVGMQWMFEGSEESPETGGLARFRGKCRRFPAEVKSPHVGWNQLEVAASSRVFRGVKAGSFVYFTHSFRVEQAEESVAWSEYGGRFSAAVELKNLFGVQFHPEKSGEIGLKILSNFCSL
jgi:imidazole glycerol-phosphate synthase subunit HisH